MAGSGGRAFGSRTRCLAGSREHTCVAHFRSLASAALLAVPLLILLTAPADAAGETSTGIDHGEAKLPGELLTVRVGEWLVSLDGLRTGPSRSLEEGEPEGIADVDRSRWRDWTWSSFEPVGDDGCAWTGWRAMAGRNLPLGSSIPITAGDSTDPGGRRSRWKQAAPIRFASAHGANGDGFIGLFGADCD